MSKTDHLSVPQMAVPTDDGGYPWSGWTAQVLLMWPCGCQYVGQADMKSKRGSIRHEDDSAQFYFPIRSGQHRRGA